MYMNRVKKQTVLCRICNKPKNRNEVRLDSKGHIKDRVCHPCRLNKYLASKGNESYRNHKMSACCVCGFVGEPCQLDVDHIDGDHSNSDPSNLQTLCANCHRLKTHKERKHNGISY